MKGDVTAGFADVRQELGSTKVEDIRLEDYHQLRTLVEAECETLSQEAQTLQKLSADNFSRVTEFESRFDTEASISRAKFDELGESLKSECLRCQELLAIDGVTMTHELQQARCLDFEAAEEKHNAEIMTLHLSLQQLEESILEDRLKFEKQWTGLKGEVTAGFANLCQELGNPESSLERSCQNDQQHFASGTEMMHQQVSECLKRRPGCRVQVSKLLQRNGEVAEWISPSTRSRARKASMEGLW